MPCPMNFTKVFYNLWKSYSGARLQQEINTKKQFGFLGDRLFTTFQELPGGLIFVTVVLDAAPCALIPKFSVCQREVNEN